jgi:hypothetical protein
VKACNNDGIRNETGASITFYLKPHFYQTSWFLTRILEYNSSLKHETTGKAIVRGKAINVTERNFKNSERTNWFQSLHTNFAHTADFDFMDRW